MALEQLEVFHATRVGTSGLLQGATAQANNYLHMRVGVDSSWGEKVKE